ncbi:MAG: hypothetical protein HQK56_17725 [Deltaproteobacteria bacterium]|nr:hypothetical protein [Deltaproteobacteria bacterium]
MSKKSKHPWKEIVSFEANVNSNKTKEAESAGPPPGVYLAKFIAAKPVERKKENGAVFVANYCLEIKDVIKINGEEPTPEQRDQLKGMRVFDDFPFPAEGERAGDRKRRIICFKRLGLLHETGGAITVKTFQAVVGKEVIITVETQPFNGKYVNRIAFSGYESPEDYHGGHDGGCEAFPFLHQLERNTLTCENRPDC